MDKITSLVDVREVLLPYGNEGIVEIPKSTWDKVEPYLYDVSKKSDPSITGVKSIAIDGVRYICKDYYGKSSLEL